MVGIFDSGLGGLTVVKEIKKRFSNLPIIYLGDTARVPYGTRSPETIKKFAKEDTIFLISKKVDVVVIACNTVSAVALDVVKKHSNVPVLDVISPIEIKIKDYKKVSLVGTRATVASNAYRRVYNRHHASLLVPLVEEGIIRGKELDMFIEKYFKQFKNTSNLILGCTHYPIIKKEIQKYLGDKIKLIDPAVEISIALKKYIMNHNSKHQADRYYLTDVNDRFVKTAKLFLGNDISKLIKKVAI